MSNEVAPLYGPLGTGILANDFAVLAPGWDPEWGYIALLTFPSVLATPPTGFALLPLAANFVNQDGTVPAGRLLFTPSVAGASYGGNSVSLSPFLVDLVNGALPTNAALVVPVAPNTSTWSWSVFGRVNQTIVSGSLPVPTGSSAWTVVFGS